MYTYNQFQNTDIPINEIIDYISGNSGLTESFIYGKTQFTDRSISVLASSEEHKVVGMIPNCNISGRPLKFVEDREGLLVIRKGKAGKTRFLSKGRFAINDDAYILFVKEDCPYKIDLRWLSIQYRNDFFSYASSSDNGTWNMTGFFNNVKIDIPDYDEQMKIVKRYSKLSRLYNSIRKYIENINILREKMLVCDYKTFQAKDMLIADIIGCMSGNSGLTEKVIYQKTQNEGKRYIVLSSSTEEDTKMGEIPFCYIDGKPLKIFENKEGLLVIRNGKAGSTLYLPKGDYTINDHAYIIYIKEDCPYKIDLRWLSIQYRNDFFSYASSSDNGTWNMTGFFNNVKIDIPDYNEQMKIVKEYEKIYNLEEKLKALLSSIKSIFSKTIV